MSRARPGDPKRQKYRIPRGCLRVQLTSQSSFQNHGDKGFATVQPYQPEATIGGFRGVLRGTWHVGCVEQLFELSDMLNAGKYSAVHRRCFVGALRGEVLVDVSRWSQIMEGV